MKSSKKVEDITRENIKTISDLEYDTFGKRSYGEKTADFFAKIIGSWSFIIFQSALILAWIIINTYRADSQWDPFPFILLNLFLSVQAAYASPIIMMSQNRQAKLDEKRNSLDLQINLLAEQESTEILHMLRQLCEKNGIKPSSLTKVLTQSTKPIRVVKQIEAIHKDENKETKLEKEKQK